VSCVACEAAEVYRDSVDVGIGALTVKALCRWEVRRISGSREGVSGLAAMLQPPHASMSPIFPVPGRTGRRKWVRGAVIGNGRLALTCIVIAQTPWREHV
jgi:hypothetical protein